MHGYALAPLGRWMGFFGTKARSISCHPTPFRHARPSSFQAMQYLLSSEPKFGFWKTFVFKQLMS